MSKPPVHLEDVEFHLGWMEAGQRFWEHCKDTCFAASLCQPIRASVHRMRKARESHLITLKRNDAPVVSFGYREDPDVVKLRILTRRLEQMIENWRE